MIPATWNSPNQESSPGGGGGGGPGSPDSASSSDITAILNTSYLAARRCTAHLHECPTQAIGKASTATTINSVRRRNLSMAKWLG
jgi:hypothetical protein